MAFVDELKAVCIVVGRTLRDFFGDTTILNRYLKQIMIAVIIVLCAAGGYFGYRAYTVSREQKAHHTFAAYMQDFSSASQADSPQEWERMIQLAEHGYRQHKESNIAPLFLSLKADAYIKRGEMVEAIDTLQQAIDLLPTSSPVLPLLQIKQSLLQLDTDDDALSKVGLQQLISLVRDTNSSLKDMALFYLGRYYWAHDQIEDAKKAWQELEDSSWQDKAYPSPWMQEVKQKLKEVAA